MLTLKSTENEFLALLDGYRSRNGITEPLTVDDWLMLAAQWRCMDQVDFEPHAYRSTSMHADHMGRSAYTALQLLGIEGGAAEIAAGLGRNGAGYAIGAFSRSAGHNRAMLSPNWTHVGICHIQSQVADYKNTWFILFRDKPCIGGDTESVMLLAGDEE